MYQNRLVTKDTYYIGGSDRRLALFENIYPLTDGVSYNSYLIQDKKTAVLDGVDVSIQEIFLEKLKSALDGKPLDYLIVQHMEPDHSGSLKELMRLYPDVTLVLNALTLQMFKNYNPDIEIKNVLLVKEGDTLTLGDHVLTFVMAPMVHWPEVMVTYDSYTKTLFSADAFGTFGALSGNLFADRVSFEKKFEDEARRYYTNIVGKYGDQVQALLKKAQGIQIENICPLHGPIWRQDLVYLMNLYDKWSRYEPEIQGVLIIYGSIYGHSEEAANIVADALGELGLNNLAVYDASKTDKSYLVAESFKYSHIVFAASTYNMGIFTPVEEVMHDLKYHNLKNRKYALIENGSWAPNSGKLMKDILSCFPNFTQIGSTVSFKSQVRGEDIEKLHALAKEIYESLPERQQESNPLFNISYGLFALSTFDGKRQNACIVNTVTQVSNNPDHLLISVNKQNYTAEVLKETKKANISILTKHTPFSLFQRFGFQSGRTTDKFSGYFDYQLADNGINYLTKYTNSYLSLKVLDVIDLGSHYGFIVEITHSKVLNCEASLTYEYYFQNIKPVPPKATKKKGWICKICGYIYEGEELPPDFICPLCKHPASDFEKIE